MNYLAQLCSPKILENTVLQMPNSTNFLKNFNDLLKISKQKAVEFITHLRMFLSVRLMDRTYAEKLIL